ncbi:hypothetical protein EP867_14440 [Falsigemmobacter intermedius]|uniref:Uncharacterized protein n=1 Tax=Falsigemmobacter intermedius TaxID=1553448 RepID=A0A444M909_9RHOB|nr:hypothetical protein EP867_14440 [Falsigemmobacter intermedius]
MNDYFLHIRNIAGITWIFARIFKILRGFIGASSDLNNRSRKFFTKYQPESANESPNNVKFCLKLTIFGSGFVFLVSRTQKAAPWAAVYGWFVFIGCGGRI